MQKLTYKRIPNIPFSGTTPHTTPTIKPIICRNQ